MKHRHLRLLGYHVVSVSYREWEEAAAGSASIEVGRRALLARKMVHALKHIKPS